MRHQKVPDISRKLVYGNVKYIGFLPIFGLFQKFSKSNALQHLGKQSKVPKHYRAK